MKQQEEITIQSLANNEDVQIGYSDNEIVIVDSIQQFTETCNAHVAMNAVVICTSGKAQAQMNCTWSFTRIRWPLSRRT